MTSTAFNPFELAAILGHLLLIGLSLVLKGLALQSRSKTARLLLAGGASASP